MFLSQMKRCWRNADEWHTLQERVGGGPPLPPGIGHSIVQMLDDAFCYLLIMQQACRGRRESAFHYSHGCCSPRRRRLAPMLEEQCHRAAAGLVLRGRRRFVMLSSEPLAAGLQLEPEQVNSVLRQHALGHRS